MQVIIYDPPAVSIAKNTSSTYMFSFDEHNNFDINSLRIFRFSPHHLNFDSKRIFHLIPNSMSQFQAIDDQ